jgi:hypothetical protein
MKKVPRGYELVDGRILKQCKPNQERNSITKRCNKVKAIPRGYERVNGRLLKKCKDNQVRNPKTGRCIKKPESQAKVMSRPKSPPK